MISEAKEVCFKEFLSMITQKNLLWCNKKYNQRSKIIDQNRSNSERRWGIIKKVRLRKHIPVIDDHYELTEDELPDIEEYEFSTEEIENSIKGIKLGGAPGYDGWTIELVEECYFTDSEWFTQGVTDFMGESKALNKVTCMVSIDLENAFNSVRWSNIKQLLEKYKVPRYLGRLLEDFFKDRSVLLTDGARRICNQAVPQGSCLGPIMWLLVANELLNAFEFDGNHRIYAFADGIIVLMRATASYHFVNNSQVIMKNCKTGLQNSD
ncbi:hypothetical protein AVEN_214967-1 [Araneus ventricosus]|uniref:Reverse transcriptase domain-containing protein n=1 Tax=Araneus ventricosus TaxID=182803 RepID=A0A4Y2MBS0_ARAVE|nr:hypothetical protein AVEN_214967-1 [Araneus ventricosus]